MNDRCTHGVLVTRTCPRCVLTYHVSGAIERGEGEPIVGHERTSRAVTKAQAEAVLAYIVAKFGEGATLHQDFDAIGFGSAPYAIVWEGGDYGWSYGVDAQVPGVWTEAATHWCLNIYSTSWL